MSELFLGALPAYLILGMQFFALAVLSLFGFHRLFLVLQYLRLRAKTPAPAARFRDLPLVTVQLPIYNEPEVVGRLIKSAVKLQYPQELLEIQVLDDSDDGSSEQIAELIDLYQAEGVNIAHIRRTSRKGFKAGALNYGLERAAGEFIAVFDADFVPPHDFIKACIHFFTNPCVGMVQQRWTHLNLTHSLLTRCQAILLDGHFQIEHTARNRSGMFFNFNGTAGIWRRTTIDEAGGWQGDTLTEDLDLSYRAQLNGSEFVYLVDRGVPAELPVQINAFKSQQHRWTKGSIEVLKKLAPTILHSNLPRPIKREAYFHLGANFCYPLMLLVGIFTLPGLLSQEIIIERWSELHWLKNAYSLVFLGAFCSLILFYGTAVIESGTLSIASAFGQVPLALIVGIGLSLNNSVAVFEALMGRKSAFVRTPKTGSGAARNSLLKTACRLQLRNRRCSTLLVVECALSIYFLCALWLAFSLGRWEAVPFISLFLMGFSMFALQGISELVIDSGGSEKQYNTRLRWFRRRKALEA